MSSETKSYNNEGFEMDNGPNGEKETNVRYAVRVFDANKRYGKNMVLENLNMNVKDGSIYALLGSSGCGKTTLLACCVGMRKLNEGEIQVFGHPPCSKEAQVPGKRVGYMPQEIALFGEFTVQEAMNYFGKIAGMKQWKINERLKFLVKFLDLPPDISRQVRNLSGGQQRRVSFAVALIHEPELLVLDEPTVGVDPLLRQCIWEHLVQITSSKKTTVIITTHYIEEASQATTLGIMRNGRLLTEKSPQFLLDTYKMGLEQTVLHLCRQDSVNVETSSSPTSFGTDNWFKKLLRFKSDSNEPTLPIVSFKRSFTKCFSDNENPAKREISTGYYESKPYTRTQALSNSKNRIMALVRKNLLCMWRNIGFVAFIFCLPAIQLILFCYTIGGNPRNINFGLINHEMKGEECQIPDGCIFANLSCNFLYALPKNDFKLTNFNNEEEAVEAIKQGLIWGYISFPEDYSKNLVEVLVSSGLTADNETLIGSRPLVRMDMTSQQIGFNVKRVFFETYQDFTKDLLVTCELGSTAGEDPITFKDPVYGLNEPDFTEFVAPAVYLILNFFMAIALTGQVLITEKKEGMFERSLVAGVTYFESILSHIIAQYGVMLGQTLLSLVILFGWFGVTNLGPLHWVLLLPILQGTCGMLLGFVISIICEEERDVMQLTLGFVMPNFLLSGVLWPLESMPPFLQSFGWYWPQTLACESMRSMLGRGWGIDHPSVYSGFVASFVWIFLLIALIYISSIMKFKSK